MEFVCFVFVNFKRKEKLTYFYVCDVNLLLTLSFWDLQRITYAYCTVRFGSVEGPNPTGLKPNRLQFFKPEP